MTLLIVFFVSVAFNVTRLYRQKGEHPKQEYVVHRVHRDNKRQVFCLIKCDAEDESYSECEEQLVVVWRILIASHQR